LKKKLKDPGFSGPERKQWGHAEPRAKTKAPHDITYGNEPDLLDKRGLIVEPDVRLKIAKYFKKMKMREIIEQLVDEMLDGIS
jgi:hypothetical protein